MANSAPGGKALIRRAKINIKLSLAILVLLLAILTTLLPLPQTTPKVSAAVSCPTGDITVTGASNQNQAGGGPATSKLEGTVCVHRWSKTSARIDKSVVVYSTVENNVNPGSNTTNCNNSEVTFGLADGNNDNTYLDTSSRSSCTITSTKTVNFNPSHTVSVVMLASPPVVRDNIIITNANLDSVSGVTNAKSTAKGTIAGGVAAFTDSGNKPCPVGTEVDIYKNPVLAGAKTVDIVVVSDNNGDFTSDPLAPGDYHIVAQCSINGKMFSVTGDRTVTPGVPVTAYLTGNNFTCDAVLNNCPLPNDTRTFKGECGNIAASPSQIIICPFIKTITAGAAVLDSYVNNMLDINSNRVFDTGGTGGYYTAWKSVRTLALALIVISGLVMVLAQAAGLEIIDAYTVRKILPRLLIMTIIIALSWPIMKFAVDLTNEVGVLTRSLIYGPFKNLSGAPFSLGGGSLALGGLLGLGGFIVLGYVGVLSYVISALVALVIGFLVLVLRQIVVTLLIVLAPIALAAYILPNTQKLYTLWWDSFSKALMMFPIIAALIAGGRVFAVVSSHASHTGAPGLATAYQVGALIAYIAPYFVLPFTVRFAGGALGALGGMVHNQRKGINESLKKYRGNKSAENLHKMKSGTRFSERNRLTKAFNRTSAGVAAGAQNQFGLTKRGRSAIATAVNSAANEYDKDPRMAAIEDDDTVVRAATYDSAAEAEAGIVAHLTKHGFASELNDPAERAAAIRAEAQRGVKGVQTSIGFGRAQAIAATRRMSTGGTPFADLQDQAETIARASGGNANTRETLSHYVSHASKGRGVDRPDLALNPHDLDHLAKAEQDGTFKGDEAGRTAFYDGAAIKAAEGSDAMSMVSARPEAVANITGSLGRQLQAHSDVITSSTSSAADRQRAQAEFNRVHVQVAALDQQKGFGSIDNQATINGVRDQAEALAARHPRS